MKFPPLISLILLSLKLFFVAGQMDMEVPHFREELEFNIKYCNSKDYVDIIVLTLNTKKLNG